jgi:hypothetical protein
MYIGLRNGRGKSNERIAGNTGKSGTILKQRWGECPVLRQTLANLVAKRVGWECEAPAEQSSAEGAATQRMMVPAFERIRLESSRVKTARHSPPLVPTYMKSQ